MTADKIMNNPVHVEGSLKSADRLRIGVGPASVCGIAASQRAVESFHMIGVNILIPDILHCLRMFRARSLIFRTLRPYFYGPANPCFSLSPSRLCGAFSSFLSVISVPLCGIIKKIPHKAAKNTEALFFPVISVPLCLCASVWDHKKKSHTKPQRTRRLCFSL